VVARIARFAVVVFLFQFQPTEGATLHEPQRPYYPAEFYTRIENGLRDDQLRSYLFHILSSAHVPVPGDGHDQLASSCGNDGPKCYQHVVLGYNRARRILFGRLHLQNTSDGWGIKDVYCERLTTRRDFRSQPPGPDQIPDSTVINAEHTWPQSRFSEQFQNEMQKSDLHHLFPTVSRANSARGNMEFGDVVTEVESPCPQSRRGFTSRNSGIHFEAPKSHKGNAARAIFYFSVRYKLGISAEEEVSLRTWNRLDPVDDEERERNEKIFELQRARNPFIDYPEMVELIANF